ncbi:hypothetical protein [Mycolicibacterium canariasense]|uniref:hypothetical protein n=1 Tax=Mycolicibacterium canariasense TaxID=228230 RepID=UPI000A148347|nr:hypothetical protein [Mycolicibacterium canariasense]MCV7208373.1 hypothetical protein [Mycolicibacterium canariasense]ORV13557.1 hypothetical protein AWB94_04870 [Mycolicibacterium canariasense]
MSLYTDIRINGDVIGKVQITRTHDDNGTDVDSVNNYRWRYTRESEHSDNDATGEIEHRYGEGAIALVAKVLTHIGNLHALGAAVVAEAQAKLLRCERCGHRHKTPGGSYLSCPDCRNGDIDDGGGCWITAAAVYHLGDTHA